jgi:two-component system response regulator YesN
MRILRNKGKNTFLTLLLSYVLILILPVLIGWGLYIKVEAIMVENAHLSQAALLEQIQIAVDGNLKEVEQIKNQITFQPNLQWLLETDRIKSAKDTYAFIKFMEDLARFNNISSFVDEIFVYFHRTEKIVTPTLSTDADTFFKDIYAYSDISYDEIKLWVTSEYHFNTILPAHSVKSDATSKNMMTIVQSLPLGEKTEMDGSLFFLIDEQKILQMRNRFYPLQSGEIYILDENKQMITTSSETNDFSPQLESLDDSYEHTSSFIYNDNEYILTSIMSPWNQWTYVTIMPKDFVLSRVNEVKLWALWMLLAVLMVGLIVSYLLAHRNYRPIREMIATILKRKNVNKHEINNEYDFIKNTMIRSMDEEMNTKQALLRQLPVIRTEFLYRLIKGYVHSSEINQEDLNFLDLRFESDVFAVALIQIDDCKQFIREDIEKEWAFVRFIITNVSSELLQYGSYYIESEKDLVIVLINPSEAASVSEIQSVLEQSQSLLLERFKTQVTIALSQIHYGTDNIHNCYREAEAALADKMIKGLGSMLLYEEIKDFEQLYYPMDLESQLMNHTKNADFFKISTLLDQIYQINFVSKKISPEMGKCLFYDLLSTQFKLVGTLGLHDQQIFDGDPVGNLVRYSSAEEMMEEIKKAYRKICNEIEDSRTDKGNDIYEKMKLYLRENYHDSMLSLTVMADHFRLNPSYMSAFFKKYSGRNITEYLTEVRIEHVKKLLGETEFPISEIAERVGYANSVGLIRMFKKSEGITPGKYRESVKR